MLVAIGLLAKIRKRCILRARLPTRCESPGHYIAIPSEDEIDDPEDRAHALQISHLDLRRGRAAAADAGGTALARPDERNSDTRCVARQQPLWPTRVCNNALPDCNQNQMQFLKLQARRRLLGFVLTTGMSGSLRETMLYQPGG